MTPLGQILQEHGPTRFNHDDNQIATLAVTTTPRAWSQNLRWTAQNRYVYAAVGLHPEVVGDRHAEITLLEECFKKPLS